MKSLLIEKIIESELQAKRFKGKVLWFSSRDGRGIIASEECENLGEGHEIYVDSSVIGDLDELKNGQRVSFVFNTNILDCACAKDVKLE